MEEITPDCRMHIVYTDGTNNMNTTGTRDEMEALSQEKSCEEDVSMVYVKNAVNGNRLVKYVNGKKIERVVKM